MSVDMEFERRARVHQARCRAVTLIALEAGALSRDEMLDCLDLVAEDVTALYQAVVMQGKTKGEER